MKEIDIVSKPQQNNAKHTPIFFVTQEMDISRGDQGMVKDFKMYYDSIE